MSHCNYRFVSCRECEEALNKVGDYIEAEKTVEEAVQHLQVCDHFKAEFYMDCFSG